MCSSQRLFTLNFFFIKTWLCWCQELKCRKSNEKSIVVLIIFDTFFYWTFNNGVYGVQVILSTSPPPTPHNHVNMTRRTFLICCHPSAFIRYGWHICFLLLFRFLHCLHRETLSLSCLLRRVSTLNMADVCLFTWHCGMCKCVFFCCAFHWQNMVQKFNVSDYQFSVGKVCSSMVTYCNAPFMVVCQALKISISTNKSHMKKSKRFERKYLRWNINK